MFCPNCGTETKTGARFCGKCGMPLREGHQAVPTTPLSVAPASRTDLPEPPSPSSAVRLPDAPPSGQPVKLTADSQAAPELGMKWFKFIIWVQLFLSAMMYFVSAFKLFFGLDYRAEGLTSDIVYSVYPGLQALDVVVALLFVLMAVMAILVRFQLNGFKSRAPMFYLGFIGVALAASLAYPVGVSLICGTPGLSITALAACLTYVALFAVNVVYFRKRRHLFVN